MPDQAVRTTTGPDLRAGLRANGETFGPAPGEAISFVDGSDVCVTADCMGDVVSFLTSASTSLHGPASLARVISLFTYLVFDTNLIYVARCRNG